MSEKRSETRPGIELNERIEAFVAGSQVVQEAFDYGREKHRGQVRHEGSEYFTHCVAVANILRTWGITDERVIAAALMHDLVEDTDVTLEDLRQRFGPEISRWVDGVSKLKSRDGVDGEAETRKKIVDRGYFEPQVVLIKLADRLHNMRTLGAVPSHKQAPKAQETLDVYAPLAESLGFWRLKTELEDLAFPYVAHDGYIQVRQEIDADPRLNETVVANRESYLTELLSTNGFIGRVEIRLKGYYEADKKRERLAKRGRGDGSFGTISDLISYRVVLAENQTELGGLDGLPACYALIGLIHQQFNEEIDMERFDDFLVQPTVSGYAALQTTVMSAQGPIEIAVTTESREDFNHWGILSKIRQGVTDFREYVQKVVFTPALKIKFLAKKATGWDFAYRISPLLGSRAVGLEINGERKPMSTVLPNAAVVKVILGQKQLVPQESDLSYVLPQAKTVMEQQIRLAQAQEATTRGRKLLEPHLSKLGLLELGDLAWTEGTPENTLSLPLAALLVEFGCTSIDSLYLQIGNHRLRSEKVIEVLSGLGITKEELGWSSIQVSGRDEPGILALLSNLLSSLEKNIVGVHTTTGHRHFDLRIVCQALTAEEQTLIKQSLSSDSISTITVV